MWHCACKLATLHGVKKHPQGWETVFVAAEWARKKVVLQEPRREQAPAPAISWDGVGRKGGLTGNGFYGRAASLTHPTLPRASMLLSGTAGCNPTGGTTSS